jgi:hypothetical protein
MSSHTHSSDWNAQQLFAVAIHQCEFNVNFFRNWGNRMRAFDQTNVELLLELADDAQQYLEKLSSTAARLFDTELPKMNLQRNKDIDQQLALPESRYFVISMTEANRVMAAARTVQKNAFEALMEIDDALQYEFRYSDTYQSIGRVLNIEGKHFGVSRNYSRSQ